MNGENVVERTPRNSFSDYVPYENVVWQYDMQRQTTGGWLSEARRTAGDVNAAGMSGARPSTLDAEDPSFIRRFLEEVMFIKPEESYMNWSDLRAYIRQKKSGFKVDVGNGSGLRPVMRGSTTLLILAFG